MRAKAGLLISFVITAFLPTKIAAQNAYNATLDGAVFKEGYANTLDVSAGIIVGLSLGQNTGITSLNETFISPPESINKDKICLRINSVDGLFWSENEFALAKIDNSLAEDFARFSPLTQSFLPELRKYGSQKIIGFGKTSNLHDPQNENHCESFDYALYPIQGEANFATNALNVYVNSSNRYTEISLSLDGSDMMINEPCKPASFDIAAIFDQVCDIKLPSEFYGQFVEATLTFSAPPFGSEAWTEIIYIPVTKREP